MPKSIANRAQLKRRVSQTSQAPSNSSSDLTRIPDPVPKSVADEPTTWLQKLMAFIEDHSLILENKANAARDQMANERTFLSWTRTCFVLVTVGIAFMQMYSIQSRARVAIADGVEYLLPIDHRLDALVNLGKPLGYLTAIFAMLVVIFGLVRFFSTQRMLQQQKFPATRVMAGLLLVFALVVLALILAIEVKST